MCTKMIAGTRAHRRRLAKPQMARRMEKPLKHRAVGSANSLSSFWILCILLLIIMKFGLQFEFHKIPEWYSEYLDYKRFKGLIKKFKVKVKAGEIQKLRGFYYLTTKRFVLPLDVFE